MRDDRPTARHGLCLLLGLFLLAALPAQQLNQPGRAELVVDGADTMIVPIATRAEAGELIVVEVRGAPSMPLAVFWSRDGLRATGTTRPGLGGQLIDLDDRSRPLENFFPGYDPGTFRTTFNGRWAQPLTLPATATVGMEAAVQAVVMDPGAPALLPLALSAATHFRVSTVATTPIAYTLQDEGTLNFPFTPLQMPGFPFYGQLHTHLNVNANGNVTFGGGDADFTPTPAEHGVRTRIAPFWTDLSPRLGGTLQVVADPLLARTRIDWLRMPLWQAIGGLRYSFSLELDHNDGSITIAHAPSNPQLLYDALVGISSGRTAGPAATTGTDLSAVSGTAGLGAGAGSIYEWFGEPTMPYYTQTFSNPYDLAGRRLRFEPVPGGGDYRLILL